MAPATPNLRQVFLQRLPVQLHRALQRHTDELSREFALIALSSSARRDNAIPGRLLELVHQLRQQYGGFGTGPADEIASAAEAGELVRDVTYSLPEGAAAAAAAVREAFEEADAFCRGGALLTLATPPILAEYREWFLSQFVRQLGGERPEPWSGPLVPPD